MLSALPNVGPYIYDVKISGFTRSSIYIYILYIYIYIYIYSAFFWGDAGVRVPLNIL
jgi:hypothetical protein